MVILTHIGGFSYRDPYHTLRENTLLGFPDSTQTNAWPFVKHNQAARHKYYIGCPGWTLIGYPFIENFNTNSFFSVLPKL